MELDRIIGASVASKSFSTETRLSRVLVICMQAEKYSWWMVRAASKCGSKCKGSMRVNCSHNKSLKVIEITPPSFAWRSLKNGVMDAKSFEKSAYVCTFEIRLLILYLSYLLQITRDSYLWIIGAVFGLCISYSVYMLLVV